MGQLNRRIVVRVSDSQYRQIADMADGRLSEFIRERALSMAGESLESLSQRIHDLDQRIHDLKTELLETERQRDQLEDRYRVIQNERSSEMERRQELIEAYQRYMDKPSRHKPREQQQLNWLSGRREMIQEAGFNDESEALEWLKYVER